MMPAALKAVGAWRETLLGRLALRCDFLVQDFLDGLLDPARFSGDASEVGWQAHDQKDLAAHVVEECDTVAGLGEGVDVFSFLAVSLPDRRARLAEWDIHTEDPRLWVLEQLTEAGVIDQNGQLIPAAWGD